MAIIPRSRTLLVLVLLANAILLLLYVRRSLPGDPEMESLAAFVLDTGKRTWVPAFALKHFSLPYNELKFYQIEAVSESGKT